MIKFYRRYKSWDMGFIVGTKVIRQWGEYLFDFKGLKVMGHYEPDGTYVVSEAITGYLITENESKVKAVKKAREILSNADSKNIESFKNMAPYYGMGAMHTSRSHIVRDNTLLGSTKKAKKYRNRVGNIYCKDCGSLYTKCLTSKKPCCPDCHCLTRSKKLEVLE